MIKHVRRLALSRRDRSSRALSRTMLGRAAVLLASTGLLGLQGGACGGNSPAGGGTGGGAALDGGSSNTGGRTNTGGASNTGGRGGATAATGGATGTGGASGTGGAAGTAGSTGAGGPVIPPIDGSCPTFATGVATIGGLAGISLQVGAKSGGTGALLFYWHGTGSTSAEVNVLIPAGVREEILAGGGVIVSFQGSLGTGGDCSGTRTFSRDDFRIADLIAACAVRDHGIDPRRIYTTGCSAGGLQAGCMGASRSSYIAAAVPNSGGVVAPVPLQDPTRVPAVMTMHGGASDMVIVSFATTSRAYNTQIKAAGGFAVNCDHGGGHCRAPAPLYTAAWEFMKAHPFGVSPKPYSSGLPASFPSYCMTF